MSTWLIDTALYTGLLIALVLVLRRPVARTFGPGMAYALWALPLLRLVLPPLVLPASLAPQAAEPAALDPSVMAMVLAAEEMNAAAPVPAAVTPAMWTWSELLLPVWLGGAALLLAWRVWSYLRMRRAMLAEAWPVGEAGKVRLVETPAVASPIAFGVLDKVVALPPRFMAMEDRRARDLAIAHELAHHRGHDIAANFAAQPLLALHWFNPLAWLGWHAMRRDQEAACDARVMAGRDRADRAAYAGVLAGFAAGPRLALAAPMACPVLGGKSIIHRLRSLAMSDISPRRRTAGRLLLGAAAVALPLTASISYAQSEAPAVEEVELAPSAAPQVHKEVRVVRLGENEDQDAAAPEADRQVRVFEHRRIDGDGAQARFHGDHPLSEEQLEELREMGRKFEGQDWEKFARKQEEFAQRMAAQGEEIAERMARMQAQMPLVETRCDGEDKPTRSWTDENGRQRIVICERAIERQALRSAVFGLRQARASISVNSELDAEVRADILEDLDKEIERIERENRES